MRDGLPERIGDYDVLGEIGRGTFGAVLLARWRGTRAGRRSSSSGRAASSGRLGSALPAGSPAPRAGSTSGRLASGFPGPGATGHAAGRLVALKVLTEVDEETVARFRREARLASRLDHPGIVRCLDAGRDRATGCYYLALEYVPGRDLKRLLAEEGPLSPRRAVDLLGQVADAVARAHRDGVVHRDLKPANVLIDDDGRAHVTDFGLARDARDRGLTRAGELIGTPNYMAPEQVRGEPATPASDVYALGALLFRALTGRAPFEAATASEVLARKVSEDARPPSAARPGLPPDLDLVCARAMARDPAARYGDATGFAWALRSAALEPAPAAEPDRAGRPGGAAAIMVGAVAAGLLLGAAVYGAVQALRDEPGPAAPADGDDGPSPSPSPSQEPTTSTPTPTPAAPAPRTPTPTPSPSPSPAATPAGPDAAERESRIAPLEDAWDGRGLERLLAAARREGWSPGALVELRRRVDAVREAEAREVRAIYRLYQDDLRPGAALERAQGCVAERPGSARLRLALARLLAIHGRPGEAEAALSEAGRLDADAEPGLRRGLGELLAVNAELLGGDAATDPTVWEAWTPWEGGVWTLEEGGRVRGGGFGMGEFQLAGLLHGEAGVLRPPFTLSVDVGLTLMEEECFGGLAFGVRGSGDAYLVYAFYEPRTLGKLPEPERERVREVVGELAPKFVRVARLQRGRWEHLATEPAAYGDDGRLELGVDVEPGRLSVRVDGVEVVRPLEVSGPLDGRVGVIKYYDDAVTFEDLRWARD